MCIIIFLTSFLSSPEKKKSKHKKGLRPEIRVVVHHEIYTAKLQAQVYNILPPALAVIGYAMRLPNTHINEFSVVLKWRYICNRQLDFTTAHIAYTSTHKTKIVFYTGGRAPCLALQCYVDSAVLLVPYKPLEGCWQCRWTDTQRSGALLHCRN